LDSPRGRNSPSALVPCSSCPTVSRRRRIIASPADFKLHNYQLGRPREKYRPGPDILSRRLIANSGFPGPANLLSSLAEVSSHSDSSPRDKSCEEHLVGNLSFNSSEEELRQVFAAFGPVNRVSLVTDRDTGKARGFGFVEMANAMDADKAIAALNGTLLDERALIVNEARPKKEPGSFRDRGPRSRGARRC
jgi:cold-inducible RNA-binding protein